MTSVEPTRAYIGVEELIARIRKYHPDDDMDLVRRAYAFAEKAHANQIRKSGDPYFCHPCAVAVILADLMLDATTIAAGLLHDCVEDVEGVTEQGITEQFGQEVAVLVDGVTKLNQLDFSSREEAQAETLRKMFLAMAKDIRVVLIKLADRLHNMRTLKFHKPERQLAIAQETLDIYAPLAHRLGVYTIKWELEDLSLRYLDPDGFYELVRLIGMKRDEREKLVADVTQELKAKLFESGIRKCEIDGRPKHIYSIYKKMKSQNKTFDQIYDLIAVRVIVSTQTECYHVLGIVHATWPQVPGRFKDYISVPKANMYQSLHTTVVTQGRPFEVQIRTFEMHRIAEYGIAAHWRYKEGKAVNELDNKLSWLRRILDWQGDVRDSTGFGEMLKVDLFADEVLVFTPKGEIVTLPKGATPLDFAYRIHSAVGNRCIGAKINHRIVPLSTQLETGDFVEIMTSSSSHGPSRDWLNIVKTSEAKAKIRAWLKREERDQNIVHGKDMLDREAKRLGYSLSQLTKTEYVETLYKRYSVQSLEDMYAMVGFGGLSTQQVLNRLVEEYKKAHKADDVLPPVAEQKEQPERPERHAPSTSSNGVIVKGESGMLVRFAKCCNPLPGDKIIGYITRGRGVSVHRADCISLKDESM
ncbi:MAG: bifunctional (p)ppGpp synthetase/guanosine-3',5'-bis(diphosphate) 3'-pyrophosphohydrolase, partial [Clostridiales bacterium]|nr:bifunctional (p)ppGpp synthetase/guanosine-3',5'-bis(diphosphate) 3'-pyrophosphohydrolase [Clostridiales bacterium]